MEMLRIDHDVDQGQTQRLLEAFFKVHLKGRDFLLFFNKDKMRLAVFLEELLYLIDRGLAAFDPKEHGPIVADGTQIRLEAILELGLNANGGVFFVVKKICQRLGKGLELAFMSQFIDDDLLVFETKDELAVMLGDVVFHRIG